MPAGFGLVYCDSDPIPGVGIIDQKIYRVSNRERRGLASSKCDQPTFRILSVKDDIGETKGASSAVFLYCGLVKQALHTVKYTPHKARIRFQAVAARRVGNAIVAVCVGGCGTKKVVRRENIVVIHFHHQVFDTHWRVRFVDYASLGTLVSHVYRPAKLPDSIRTSVSERPCPRLKTVSRTQAACPLSARTRTGPCPAMDSAR